MSRSFVLFSVLLIAGIALVAANQAAYTRHIVRRHTDLHRRNVVNRQQGKDCSPSEFHISLGEYYSPSVKVIDPNTTIADQLDNVIYVVYRTNGPCPNTGVRFTDPKNSSFVVTPVDVPFKTSYNVYYKVDYDTTYHIVTLKNNNLTFGGIYTYQAVVNTQNFGKVFTFTLPDRDLSTAKNGASAFNFRIFGDFDNSNFSASTRDALLKDLTKTNNSATLLVTGDIAYEIDKNNGKTGEEFMASLEPLFSRYPLMNSAGNHENSNDYAFYRAMFMFPYDSLTQNHFFSFNQGPIHFICINSDKAVTNASWLPTLLNWLENDLKFADTDAQREERPWIVVYTHRLFFTSDKDEAGVEALYPNVNKAIDALFLKYNVDIFFSGHIHAYQRTAPIANNASAGAHGGNGDSEVQNAKGTIHITEGIMGTKSTSKLENYAKRDYILKVDNRTGYGSMSVADKWTLNFQHVLGDGTVFDKVKLSKTVKRPFHEQPLPGGLTLPMILLIAGGALLLLIIIIVICVVVRRRKAAASHQQLHETK